MHKYAANTGPNTGRKYIGKFAAFCREILFVEGRRSRGAECGEEGNQIPGFYNF